jgi:hypothetical protein
MLVLGNGVDWLRGQNPHSLFIVSDLPIHMGIEPYQAIYEAASTYLILGGVAQLKGDPEGRKIPGEKSPDVYFEVLSTFSPQTVVDPFMGTGTTGEAALRAGHDFIGIEIVAERYKMAVDRLREWE